MSLEELHPYDAMPTPATNLPTSQIWAVLTQRSKPSQRFWFSFSLVFAAIYGLLALHQAFDGQYVIQDDARQHIFWMQRYLDPELFPGDMIADYFQATAPIGYAAFYRFLASLGLEPAILAKLLPPVLGLVCAGYCFLTSLELLPIPLSGFLASVMLSQTLWASDELSSGTPRAFLYPLTLAFLYYLLRRSHLVCLVLVGLQILFYPQTALIALGLVAVRLIRWREGKMTLSPDWRDYCLLGLGCCLLLSLMAYTRGLSEFGDVVTRAEAMAMPEFQERGRNAFFLPGLRYWLDGYPGRSGILHRRTGIPAMIFVGVLLPLLLNLPAKTELRRQVKPGIHLLTQLLIVSFGLFAIAHLILFELHLPSRYTSHNIRIVLALAAGITWVMLLDYLWRFAQDLYVRLGSRQRSPAVATLSACLTNLLPLGITGALFLSLFFYYPLLLKDFPKAGYKHLDQAQPVYEFFAEQPKDILIASLSGEASNIPAFAARSVLVSREHGLPYHKDYYDEFRQRSQDLITAQYAQDPSVVMRFSQTYDIDFWLLDGNAFDVAYLPGHKWGQQFQPMANDATESLEQGAQPVVQQSIEACSVLQASGWIVLEGACVREFAETQDVP